MKSKRKSSQTEDRIFKTKKRFLQSCEFIVRNAWKGSTEHERRQYTGLDEDAPITLERLVAIKLREASLWWKTNRRNKTKHL